MSVECRDCATSISAPDAGDGDRRLLVLRPCMNWETVRSTRTYRDHSVVTQRLSITRLPRTWGGQTYWRWGRCPRGTVPLRKPGHRFSEIHNLKRGGKAVYSACRSEWYHVKVLRYKTPWIQKSFEAFCEVFNHSLIHKEHCRNILQPPNGHVGTPQIPVSCSHQNCKHYGEL